MLIYLVAFCAVALSAEGLTLRSNLKDHWHNFKKAHGKDYHPHVDLKKRIVFAENIKHILEHNIKADLGLSDHKLGINKYSDISHDEFVRKMNGLNKTAFAIQRRTMSRKDDLHVPLLRSADLPTEVDWVKAGAVTEVKDQGECGSCWTFSAVGAMEGAWHKKTGQLVSLSEQNLLDCANDYGNHGCEGGLPDAAFQYVIDRKGVDREECYPYYGMQFQCYFNPTCIGAHISQHKSVEEGNEEALKEAIATVGPIAVAIDASHISLQHYKDGVYSDPECSSTDLDHAVLLVGYGVENGKDYWKIKNSWGTSWGQNGYFKLARNAKNHCGIGTYTAYPIV